MDPIPQIDERLRKLLLYVGEQGKQFQARDVKHLFTSVQSIFEKHMKLQTQFTPLISLITKCIISVPNKQHLYALMTGYLTRSNEDKMDELLNCVLLQFQSSMNTFKEITALNILIYLSQLMNFNILNSFIFISWIESIVAELKKVQGNERQFYLNIVVKIIPYCWKSLDQKIGQDFKKLIDKIQKQSTKMSKSLGQLWVMIYQQYSNKKLQDYSTQQRLQITDIQKLNLQENENQKQKEVQVEFKQFNPSFKLSFKDKTGTFNALEQTKLQFQDQDTVYRQFLKSIETYLDKQNITTIIQTFIDLKSVLYQKLKQYLVVNSNKPFLIKLMIEIMWKQIFVRPAHETVVFVSVFISMNNEGEVDLKRDLIKSIQEVALNIFRIGESLNSIETQKFINAVSLYHANIHNAWEWNSWVEQENMVNRHVILRLIFQKIGILSDFKPTPEMEPFIVPKFQPALLDSQQSMFESKILEFLNAKAQSQQIMTFVNNQSEFVIFFNLLLARMKNSLTHLTKLTERYRQVFKHFKYDRQTVDCIFDFWQNSEYHKIQYFLVFLQNQMINFEKLVEGISMKAKLSDSIEKILLRRVYEKVKSKTTEDTTIDQILANDLEQSLAL